MSKLIAVLTLVAIISAVFASRTGASFEWGFSGFPYPSDDKLVKEFKYTFESLQPETARSDCPDRLNEVVQACLWNKDCNAALLEKVKQFADAHNTDIISENEREICS